LIKIELLLEDDLVYKCLNTSVYSQASYLTLH